MLFKQIHLNGIKAGTVSLAFRRWEKPAVNKGSLLKTAIGLVEIRDIHMIKEKDPFLRAVDLAAKSGMTKKWLKLNVREKVGAHHRPGMLIFSPRYLGFSPCLAAIIQSLLSYWNSRLFHPSVTAM